MVDHYQAAVACVIFRNGNHSVRGRVNRRAVIGGHVHSRVKRAFAAEGVEPFAKAIRDVAHHRPNRGRVGRVGKVHRREEMQSAAGDGDHCGVALQERVLLDGAVKRVLGIHRVVALVERRRVVAQHAVGHGHFGREGLEGIEALVGIVDRGLQLAVLLSPGLQFVANGVVISNFPEHSGVGGDGGGYADSPNQGQNGDTVY